MIVQDSTSYVVDMPYDKRTENTDHNVELGPKQVSKNVWYRNFLKPLIRDTHPTYKDAFMRRVVPSVGIPVSEIDGVHALFKVEFRHYSPLQGMIFSYNNYINNLHRYGDKDQEPAAALVQELFHILPGGEIQPTHAGRNAGAHLSPGLIGDIFQEIERLKSQSNHQTLVAIQQQLSEVISKHEDYRANTEKLQDDALKAKMALQELYQKDNEAAGVRQRIKELEGDIIKLNRHKIKRLKKEQRKADERRQTEIEREVQQLTTQNEQTEVELKELRSHIVTSLDFKIALKNLHRAEDAVELELQSRAALANIMAQSFELYEFAVDAEETRHFHLFQYSTTAILLAYIWRKYDSIGAFQAYFEAMDHMGALNASLSYVMDLICSRCAHSSHSSDNSDASVKSSHTQGSSTETYLKRESNIPTTIHRTLKIRPGWSPSEIEKAARITISNPDNDDRPTVIVFSYVTWAAYSEFPDCGETALRNLLNQLVFNPDTGKFDSEVLEELKEKHYPAMSDALIQFYQRNDTPQDSVDIRVAVEWIHVVSQLNKLRGWTKDHAMHIKYRREKEEQNIASPLRNALHVINGLLGVDNIEGPELVRNLSDQINNLRGLDLEVDLSGVKSDGFGVLALSADSGRIRYELQSYKPVHFGFVPAEQRRMGKHPHHPSLATRRSTAHHNFQTFRKLMKHSNLPTRQRLTGSTMAKDTEYFQKLALASLFVPYTLRRKTIGKIFRQLPAHYVLWLVDWESEKRRQDALQWVTSNSTIARDAKVCQFLERVETYVEPEFIPTKKDSAKIDEEEADGDQAESANP